VVLVTGESNNLANFVRQGQKEPISNYKTNTFLPQRHKEKCKEIHIKFTKSEAIIQCLLQKT
jgi:hypothetical protein